MLWRGEKRDQFVFKTQQDISLHPKCNLFSRLYTEHVLKQFLKFARKHLKKEI